MRVAVSRPAVGAGLVLCSLCSLFIRSSVTSVVVALPFRVCLMKGTSELGT